MDTGLFVALTAACALLAGGLLAVVLLLLRDRHRLSGHLASARDDVAAVERRLEALTRRLEERARREEQEWVITTAPAADAPAQRREVAVREPVEPLTAREFASVAVGESLVTVFSFGHGVRRALSAENRNRIRFEMRREVRRARKQRRHELKEARRTLRSAQRADLSGHAA